MSLKMHDQHTEVGYPPNSYYPVLIFIAPRKKKEASRGLNIAHGTTKYKRLLIKSFHDIGSSCCNPMMHFCFSTWRFLRKTYVLLFFTASQTD